MKRGSRYPKGSPKDILVRLLRTEREVRQILTDIQSCNDNNPNFRDKPMDVGRYLVQLKRLRSVIEEVRAVVASGASKLPSDILVPIIEPW